MVPLMRHDRCPGAGGIVTITIVAGLAISPASLAQPDPVEAGGISVTVQSSPENVPESIPEEGLTCPLVQVTLWNDHDGLVIRRVPYCIEIKHTATIISGNRP